MTPQSPGVLGAQEVSGGRPDKETSAGLGLPPQPPLLVTASSGENSEHSSQFLPVLVSRPPLWAPQALPPLKGAAPTAQRPGPEEPFPALNAWAQSHLPSVSGTEAAGSRPSRVPAPGHGQGRHSGARLAPSTGSGSRSGWDCGGGRAVDQNLSRHPEARPPPFLPSHTHLNPVCSTVC